MRGNFKLPINLLIVISLISTHALALDYELETSGCASMGVWTQKALASAKALQGILKSLSNDPNCVGMSHVVKTVEELAKLLEVSKIRKDEENELESLPNQLSIIRGGLNQQISKDKQLKPMAREQWLKLLAKKTIDLGAAKAVGGSAAAAIVVADKAISLANRTAVVTRLGNIQLNHLFQQLPKYDQCLEGRPSEAGLLISASIELVAAFASNNEGTLSEFSKTIGSFLQLTRNARFAKATRQISKKQLELSLSCLLEILSQNYCTAYDSRTLLEQNKHDEMAATRDISKLADDFENPLTGYFILSRPLRTINGWLQEIQSGFAPKFATEAQFKNSIWDTVMSTIKANNKLWGAYYHHKNFMSELDKIPDVEQRVVARRAHAYQLVISLTNTVTKDLARAGDNFFAKIKTEDLLPWFFIGVKDIPPQLRPQESDDEETKPQAVKPVADPTDKKKKYGMSENNWQKVMRGDGIKFFPSSQFEDPDKLMEIIKNQLEFLTEQSGVLASQYFRRFLIIDFGDLVARSLTGQNYSVYESFQTIYVYLGQLEKRVRELSNNGDPAADLALIPNIEDTRLKIDEFLKAYNGIKNFNEKLQSKTLPPVVTNQRLVGDLVSSQSTNDPDKSLQQKIREFNEQANKNNAQIDELSSKQIEVYKKNVASAYQKIIDLAYANFNVLLQRDNFLTLRLTNLVRADYAIRMRTRQDLTRYESQLMRASDNRLIEMLLELQGKNPNAVQQDLDNALKINADNIFAFETTFRDILHKLMLEKSLIIKNQRPSNNDLNKQTFARFYKDVMASVRDIHSKTYGFSFFMNPFFGGPIVLQSGVAAVKLVRHSDLYQLEMPGTLKRPRDLGGVGARNFAQLCIQTMSFQNWGFFNDLCKGVKLEAAWYSPKSDFDSFEVSYDQLTQKQRKTLYRDDTDRVCALRDYGRNHYVYWLTHELGAQ